eukprot:g3503.t1
MRVLLTFLVVFVSASSGQYTNGVDKFGRHEEPIQPEFIRLCVNGKFARVKKILEKADEEKKKEILNTVDSNGRNALISALERFQPNIARLLIEHGADVNQHDSKQHTALHWALWRKEIEIAETLIEKGADVNHTGPQGEKPALLWVAVHTELKDHDYLMHQMIDAGADVDARDLGGMTALAISAMNGHEACVKALLKRNANPDLISYETRFSPLYLAAMNGYESIARDLVEAGADLAIKDSRGFTALDIAKRNGRRKIVSIIESALEKSETKSEL